MSPGHWHVSAADARGGGRVRLSAAAEAAGSAWAAGGRGEGARRAAAAACMGPRARGWAVAASEVPRWRGSSLPLGPGRCSAYKGSGSGPSRPAEVAGERKRRLICPCWGLCLVAIGTGMDDGSHWITCCFSHAENKFDMQLHCNEGVWVDAEA